MLPKDFIQKIKDQITSIHTSSVPLSFCIAQAALESGWGSSQLTQKANNLFGVKADKSWHGLTLNMPTAEYVHGKKITVNASWRVYPTWADSILDHALFFVKNPRYATALKTKNPFDFAHAIADAGYATDPNYADKIISIINLYNLTEFDA